MALVAMALAACLVWLDAAHGPVDWATRVFGLRDISPEAARTILATIAGAMITVASVTFSLTLLAVSHATNNLGARVLPNFMRDRGNQVSLGTFSSAFLYCLIVLLSVKDARVELEATAFVPQLAVFVGVGLAVASTVVLIYFFHHVPASIYVYNIVADTRNDLVSQIRALVGAAADEEAAVDAGKSAEAVVAEARAPRSGYIQEIDAQKLVRIARAGDVRIELVHQPGAFVLRHSMLARIHARSRPGDLSESELLEAFELGDERTASQDLMFHIDQLVQIAARALSPGLNDPFSANTCLDFLTEAIAEASGLPESRNTWRDDDGEIRVTAPRPDFSHVLNRVFNALRPYLAADRNAAIHGLYSLGMLLEVVRDRTQVRAIREHIEALSSAACARLTDEIDRQRVEEVAAECRRIADGEVEPDQGAELAESS